VLSRTAIRSIFRIGSEATAFGSSAERPGPTFPHTRLSAMTHTRVYGRTESRYSVHENIYPVDVPVRIWRKDEHAQNANCPVSFLPICNVWQPLARSVINRWPQVHQYTIHRAQCVNDLPGSFCDVITFRVSPPPPPPMHILAIPTTFAACSEQIY